MRTEPEARVALSLISGRAPRTAGRHRLDLMDLVPQYGSVLERVRGSAIVTNRTSRDKSADVLVFCDLCSHAQYASYNYKQTHLGGRQHMTNRCKLHVPTTTGLDAPLRQCRGCAYNPGSRARRLRHQNAAKRSALDTPATTSSPHDVGFFRALGRGARMCHTLAPRWCKCRQLARTRREKYI